MLKQKVKYLDSEEYSFPFEYKLPDNLPSSFEHMNGNVRYKIQGIIEIPWSLDRYSFKTIRIKSETNLNKYHLNLASSIEVIRSFDVPFSLGGTIHVEFSVNKRGFVMGENILCTARVNNQTSRYVIRNSIKLVREITFAGVELSHFFEKRSVKRERQNIETVCINKIIPEATIDYVVKNKGIRIPETIPTSNGLCKIIRINYFVLFECGVWESVDKTIEIPIIIGTIPLENTATVESSSSNSASSSGRASSADCASPSDHNIPSNDVSSHDRLPSYEEFISKKIGSINNQ